MPPPRVGVWGGGDRTLTSGCDCPGAGPAGARGAGRTAPAHLALLGLSLEPGQALEVVARPPRGSGRARGEREGTRTALHTRGAGGGGVLMRSSCSRSADLGLLLGMALGNQGLEMWPLTQNEECAVTGFLRDKLQYRNRLQYMVTVQAAPCPPSRALGSQGAGLGRPSSVASVLSPLAPFSSFPTVCTWPPHTVPSPASQPGGLHPCCSV